MTSKSVDKKNRERGRKAAETRKRNKEAQFLKDQEFKVAEDSIPAEVADKQQAYENAGQAVKPIAKPIPAHLLSNIDTVRFYAEIGLIDSTISTLEDRIQLLCQRRHRLSSDPTLINVMLAY
jgi:hypothetical protein